MQTSWQYYIQQFKGKKWVLLSCVLTSIVQSTALVGITWLVKYLFDQTIPQKNLQELIYIGLLIIVLYAINALLALYDRYRILKLTQEVTLTIRNLLTQRLLQSDKHQYEYWASVGLHTRIVQDTERVDTMGNALVAQLLPALVISIAICVGLLYLNTLFFFTTILLIPFIVGLSKWLGGLVNKAIQVFHQYFDRFSKGINHLIVHWPLIQMRAFGEEAAKVQQNINRAYGEARTKGAWWQTAFTVMQDSLLAVGGVVLIILGGYYVIEEVMTWGELFSFYVALALLKTHVYRMATNIPQVLEGGVSLRKIHQVLQMPPSVYQGSKEIDFEGNIAFKKVSFQLGDRTLLKDVSFDIQKGQKIGLRGKNGVGKTTLIQLLLGFYPPKQGEIYAASHPYKQINLVKVLQKIGVVMQQPLLFQGTIKENLCYGLPMCTETQIQEACEIALATDFIRKLPKGFETPLQGNHLLSGGQIQQLVIARALLKKPHLLILDEPFNHLDQQVAKHILHNLLQLPYQPSILLVSHQKWALEAMEIVWELTEGGLQHHKNLGHSLFL
ncbi:MAG: ABC transporter ATP-binding protein [Thermonemataceae bacterium]